jgi:uncharacterized protein YjdB
MFSRYCFRALGLICLLLPIAGCTNTQVDTISVTPATQSLAVGQTAQMTATGTISHGNHPASTENITGQVTWTSNDSGVASVTSTGAVTAVAPGTATISASLPGLPAGTATITVTGTSTTTTGGSVTTLTIIPSSQAVASPGQTTQFIAIGTTSTQATEDLTSQVIWSSSNPQVGTVGTTTGIATAAGQGTTTITAIYVNGTSGTVATGTATFTVTGGNSEQYTALTITPASQSVSSGGEAQFLALGTSGSTGLQVDVTDHVTWSTSISTIAAFNVTGAAKGQVTGLSAGTTAVTALFTNTDNSVVTATGSVTVTSAAPPEPLLSLAIVPSSITVGNLQDTGNFLAIGTFSTVPYVRDLTNSVTWISSEPNVFPVSTDSTSPAPANEGAPGGIVTAIGSGTAVIIAEATASDLTIQTATATFSCPYLLPAPPQPGSCFVGSEASSLLSTVTVYNEGLNTTDWEVTASSATGTPDVIHCGPGWALNGGTGGSVCVGTYPIGTPVVLTAPAGAGSFGGWSANCTPNPNPPTAAGPNSCTITPTTYNESVGAIFN